MRTRVDWKRSFGCVCKPATCHRLPMRAPLLLLVKGSSGRSSVRLVRQHSSGRPSPEAALRRRRQPATVVLARTDQAIDSMSLRPARASRCRRRPQVRQTRRFGLRNFLVARHEIRIGPAGRGTSPAHATGTSREPPTLMHHDFLSGPLRAQPLVPCGAADGHSRRMSAYQQAHAVQAASVPQRAPTQPLQRVSHGPDALGWYRTLAAMPWPCDIGAGHLQATHGSYGAVPIIAQVAYNG